MKRVTALVVLALACAPSWGQKAEPARTDTRSDALRTESVKAASSNLRLNLNSASAVELAKLPGVGDARARSIVKGRPYRSKDELLRRKILPADVYENVKANVYAGR